MRAWLLLLAVLATFQPYVQVASTEDISRIFITAISPSSIANNSITQRRTPTQALAAAHETSERLRTVIQAHPSATLSKAFNPLIDLTAAATNLPPSATSKPRAAAAAITPTLSTSIAASIFLYGNSDSDKNTIYNNRTRYSHNHNHKTNIASTVDNVIIDTNAIDQVYSTEINRRYDALEFHQTSQVQQSSPQLESYIPTTIIDNTVTQNNINRNMEMSAKASNGFHNSDHERLQTKQPVSSRPNASLEANSIDRGIESEADEIETEDTYSSSEIFDVKLKPDPSTLVEIENSLLSLFNMKRPPKIDRSKIVIPEAMKQLYAQIMGHELDSVNIPKPGILTKSANTVRSFTHQDSKIDDRFPHHHRFRLFFDIKSIPGDEKLKAAEVQLTRDTISHAALNPRLANRTRYQVLVYDITRVGVRGKREPSYLLLDNKTIRLNSTDTVSLDVQPAVNRWLASPNKNYGLLVEVRTMRTQKPAPHHHVRLRRSADEPHDVWQHKQPLLFAYTDDGQHKARSIRDVSARSKRAGNGGGHHHRRSHRRKNNDEQCRRHALYVDFADVGWSDWIVAPPGYDAFYCHGKCPFPLAEHLNSTNHAVVQTLVNNINPGKVPKACCVPTQLEGISMLYLNDQNTVVLKNYQEMTVVGCGCR